MFFAQIDMGHETAVGIDITFVLVSLFGFVLLFSVIPAPLCLANNPHVPAPDGLAEKVIGPDLDIGVLSREVVGPIRFYFQREVRQVVTTDLYIGGAIPLVAIVVDFNFDAIFAEPRVVGNRPITAGDAEA